MICLLTPIHHQRNEMVQEQPVKLLQSIFSRSRTCEKSVEEHKHIFLILRLGTAAKKENVGLTDEPIPTLSKAIEDHSNKTPTKRWFGKCTVIGS